MYIMAVGRETGGHMVKMEATKARNEFSELLSTVKYGSGRVVIERRGKEVAALISVEDLHLLEMIEDEIDLEAARKALANPKNKVRVPLEAVKKRLGA
jgi:prevent-host-death family protein